MQSFGKSRPVILLAVLLVVMAALIGCAKSGDQANENGEGLSGTVKVAGSTSVQPLVDELAEFFMDENPDVNISVQGGGSSAGVEAANTGTAQIGTSSRELKESEKGYGLTETVIAKDGIGVVVNSKNQVADLTLDQIKKIFSGEIKDWSEVGGKQGPITVVVREEGSGTRGAFEEIVLKDARVIPGAIVQNSTGAIKTAVSTNDSAIGFISLGSIDSGVKALKVGGVEPAESTVLDGSYKIARPFLFLTKGETNATTKAFIDFVLSTEGQKIVSENFIKVK